MSTGSSSLSTVLPHTHRGKGRAGAGGMLVVWTHTALSCFGGLIKSSSSLETFDWRLPIRMSLMLISLVRFNNSDCNVSICSSSAHIAWALLDKASTWFSEGSIFPMATSAIWSELALPFETAPTSDWPELGLLRFDFLREREPLPLLFWKLSSLPEWVDQWHTIS